MLPIDPAWADILALAAENGSDGGGSYLPSVSPLDLFWILLIFAALQPYIRQKMMEVARRRMIRAIEEERASRVILLVHRQETMALLGFPVFRYIDMQDSEQVLRAIHMTDDDVPIDLVLHTPGGIVLAALQIARAVHDHPAETRVIVPHYAMSGGTLIALAADEIVMNEDAVLGPVDPQIGQQPAASIVKVLRQKPMAEIDDETLILADQAQMAIGQLHKAVCKLLADDRDPEEADEIAGVLTEGTWTHDFPIDYDTAKDLGLNVTEEMPGSVEELMNLFPQPTRRQSWVEYLPGRRHKDAG